MEPQSHTHWDGHWACNTDSAGVGPAGARVDRRTPFRGVQLQCHSPELGRWSRAGVGTVFLCGR
jgi:hypothetical protein